MIGYYISLAGIFAQFSWYYSN